MKSFGVILSVLLSFSAFSQLDNYIVNEDGLWSTVIVHCVPAGNNYATYFTKFEGDTIIDGYSYKKIWRCDEEDLINWSTDGFIRENEDHQVFLKPPDYIEGLIYDFGVSPGDSVEALNVYLNSSNILHFVVTEVDSVLLLDGYRKRVTLYEYINQKEEVWIEGVGSYFGILNSCNDAYGIACGGFSALCYKENGSLVYQEPVYATCFYSVTVGLSSVKQERLQVYPNPAKNFVSITFPNNSGRWVEVWDFSGKIIEKNLFFEKNILLNLQEVDNGMYIIKVLDDENYYLPFKLIVD